MKLFITGGAPDISKPCVQKAFGERGHEIVVYDNLSTVMNGLFFTATLYRAIWKMKNYLTIH